MSENALTSEVTTSTNSGATASPAPVQGTRTASAVGSIQGYDAQAAALSPRVQRSPLAPETSLRPQPRPEGLGQEEQAADPRLVYSQYRTWIEARILELNGLEGQAKLDRARGLLWQMEDLVIRMRTQCILVDRLNTQPSAGAPQDCGGVPPEWIEPARQIIEVVENEIEGVNLTSANSRVEGSRYADEDWNSRLGVPQYRTQSDNLASPEATCNGTSFAMAIERLGVSRAAVVSACESTMGLTAESTPEQITEKWTTKVGEYLAAENSRSYNYQKIRGRAQSQDTRNVMASTFRENAQMEDVVLFLAWLKGISRTSITSSSANIETLLTTIDGTASGNIATVEKITNMGTWEALLPRVQACLNGGGGVIFSFYHKGNKAGESGKTHIITVQQALSDGFIVDDPYGRARTDYSHEEYGDAYAAAGSMSRTTKNTVDRETANDWHVDQAQDPTANETRGRSYKMTKKTIEESFYYIQLLSRPAS